jgi:hypothetical protein
MVRKTVFLLLLIGVISVGVAGAYPPCGPTTPQTQAGSLSEAFCRPAYIGGELLRIKPSIPFAWLRTQPASDAPIVTTIFPTTQASLTVVSGSSASITFWDGVQWWWLVRAHHGVSGWVEQASLVDATPTTASVTMQGTSTNRQAARAKAGIPFIWVRETPSSGAGILSTIFPGQTFTVTGTPSEWDGAQWWWQVQVNTANGSVTGWVEQTSIQPI